VLYLFKDQQPRRLILLVLLLLVSRLPLLVMGVPLPGDVSVLPQSIPDSLLILIASALIFIQAIWINYIFSEAQITDQRTFVPAAVWIIITLLDKGYMVPGEPMLICFVIIALVHSLMDIRQEEASAKQCYNSGFLLGIAIALHPPFILYLPILILSLFNLRAYGIREYLIAILGVMTPLFWAWSYFYITGAEYGWLHELKEKLQPANFELDIYLQIGTALILFVSLAGLVSLAGIVQSAGFKRKKNVRSILYQTGGVSLVFVFSKDWIFANSFFVLVPLCMLISTLLLRINKKLIPDLLFGIFAIILITLQILSSVI
jgi:hypothetical protein